MNYFFQILLYVFTLFFANSSGVACVDSQFSKYDLSTGEMLVCSYSDDAARTLELSYEDFQKITINTAGKSKDDIVKAVVSVAKEGDELAAILAKSGEDFTILTNARKLPGTVSGMGKEITGKWLRGTGGNAGLFPKSVADKLSGRTFNNFDEFRQAFWKEVANDPNLTKQFEPQQVLRMKDGLAPYVKEIQQLGGQRNYILHHKTPINQGGGVYDVDNLYIVTPRYHKEILAPAFHYGYGY